MTPDKREGLRPLLGLGLSSGVGAAFGYVFGALVEWAAEYLGVAPQPAWLKAALGGIGLLLFAGGWLLWYFWPVIRGQSGQSATKPEKDDPVLPPLSPDAEKILGFLMQHYPEIKRQKEIVEAIGLPLSVVSFSLEDLQKRGFVCPPKYQLIDPFSETGLVSPAFWGTQILEPGVGYLRGRKANEVGKPGSWRYGSK